MSIALLDINDSNLQLWHLDSRLQSPGYALLQGQQYLFGAAARAAARLQPRDINTRYWWQLSTEALQPALGPARHTGDLAHAHLAQLHREANEPAEVLLAVSGSMQHEQLALLLGIVQQCPFDAVGLVNRSVALGSLYSAGERLFHLEIQLHQAVISELVDGDNGLQLQRTVPLPGCGLLQLQERLVEVIAAAFVRQTRFDPRRKAATEQQLYDVLPAALQTLRSNAETNLDVSGYRARVSAHELHTASMRLFDSARESIGDLRSGDQVIADPIAALLPGLATEFPGLNILKPDDMRVALHAHEEQLVQRDRALHYVTALPCLKQKPELGVAISDVPPTAKASPPIIKPTTRPTHLLRQHIARPLTQSGIKLAGDWELYRSTRGWELRGSAPPVQVNDHDYQAGQLVGTGDNVTVGDGETMILIEVEA